MKQSSASLSGFFIALGLITASIVLGAALLKFKQSDRYVTVKGLVERDVAADLAVWPLRFSVAGNDLGALQQQIQQQEGEVIAFLKSSGLSDNEIISNGLSVFNREAVEYSSQGAGQPKYTLKASLVARSNNVGAVSKASQSSSALIAKGVALQQDECNPGPVYSFTKLNEIKPDMLAEATKNARSAAEQFAVSSGSKVGSIRLANQGVFSVIDRDRASEGSDNGSCGKPSDLNKRVRVVTTLDYYLQD